MLGLTFEKLVVIAIFAALLLGPERLPLYAAKLADLVRAVRAFTETAKARAAEQLGPEFEHTDWTKLDPRRYDPRRIIQEALASDEDTSPTSGRNSLAPTRTPADRAPLPPDQEDAPPPAPASRRSSDGHLIRA